MSLIDKGVTSNACYALAGLYYFPFISRHSAKGSMNTPSNIGFAFISRLLAKGSMNIHSNIGFSFTN